MLGCAASGRQRPKSPSCRHDASPKRIGLGSVRGQSPREEREAVPPEPKSAVGIGPSKRSPDDGSVSCQKTKAIGGGCVLMASVCGLQRHAFPFLRTARIPSSPCLAGPRRHSATAARWFVVWELAKRIVSEGDDVRRGRGRRPWKAGPCRHLRPSPIEQKAPARSVKREVQLTLSFSVSRPAPADEPAAASRPKR